MRSRRQAVTAIACWLTALLPSAQVATAQNSVRIGTVVAAAGERGVVVPIDARTTDPLTLLSMDLTFERSLCARISNQTVTASGRTAAAVQEDGVKCPEEGRIRLVLLDLTGASVVPPGDGPIIDWQFDVATSAEGGVFPLGLTLIQASNGPVRVPVEVTGGSLTIVGEPTTTPPAATPTRTVPTPSSCAGDCNGDGVVTIDELLQAVQIALGTQGLASCPAIDRNADGVVSVSELVDGVEAALAGCPPAG